MTDSKAEIAEVINSWAFHRDQEAWDELLGSFHADGAISLSWFDGSYEAFVAASKRLATRGNTVLKHYVGTPRIRVNTDRALSETNVTIMLRTRTPIGEVDTTSYARFFDYVEKRQGRWKILRRTAIYEKDRADPVERATLPEAFFQDLDQYPRELRFLASSLKRVGAELSKATVLDKSQEMERLYREGDAWLSGG